MAHVVALVAERYEPMMKIGAGESIPDVFIDS
jgi:hypothetical protein